MANTQIIIDATDTTNNQPVKKTITDINPKASNEQLATFGTMLNALTTNVYGGTTKITKVNCDGEASKPVPTLQIVNGQQQVVTSFTAQKPTSGIAVKEFDGFLQYTGDSQLLVTYHNDTPRFALGSFDTTTGEIIAFVSNYTANGTYNFTLYAPESDNYQAASFEFTVTVTD